MDVDVTVTQWNSFYRNRETADRWDLAHGSKSKSLEEVLDIWTAADSDQMFKQHQEDQNPHLDISAS